MPIIKTAGAAFMLEVVSTIVATALIIAFAVFVFRADIYYVDDDGNRYEERRPVKISEDEPRIAYIPDTHMKCNKDYWVAAVFGFFAVCSAIFVSGLYANKWKAFIPPPEQLSQKAKLFETGEINNGESNRFDYIELPDKQRLIISSFRRRWRAKFKK